MKSAIILLSGGLDSATVLAIAKQQGFACYALSFDYGQRAQSELAAAKRVALSNQVIQHQIIPLTFDLFTGSALTDQQIEIPEQSEDQIPVTYVPARNTVFLSMALAWAEVLKAQDIFIGVNALDYSGYPDCRPEFIQAYQKLAHLATKAGIEGERLRINAPLIHKTKAQIIQMGALLDVDYAQTVSCYQADEQGFACNHCDSCRLRALGFKEAGIEDPTRYQSRENKT